MHGKRNLIRYLMLVTIVMICGLSARSFSSFLPLWINLYLGDILWGLMVFFLFGLLFRARPTRVVAAGALIFSYAVEISQLYHSYWIDSLRHTSIGGLVLGYGFLWSDLISYTLGIGFGLLIERRLN
ncbi:hypothetical protein DP73_13470 [Desulfosporosinus sp. HMP52]|uniref:ribosomal maturation YjgA family protein n=1 Tax=Desulfosporosinus sp. HMP52 TaxID=1487923 RepID=UPI00051FE6B9|nr:DUF2809 domain-containing protein [Desulfosporosinus sp. HMP52]KGK88108.1 hypothetical protein DP73_13470 [Desulfosporosinus sp. HMP52]